MISYVKIKTENIFIKDSEVEDEKENLIMYSIVGNVLHYFSCEKEKGVNDSATESKVIAITETKEVDTTVAKKNVEIKNQIYTDEQISEAEKVASDYYKNFAHKVKDLKFKKIKGKKSDISNI